MVIRKIYSQDLINNLFKRPYTTIGLLEKDLNVSYLTARKYLDKVVDLELLEKVKRGKKNYYVNVELIKILQNL